ncbi:MAG: AmmeMemoRadiSam system protein B [Candidatus Pacebacteria bacterium]|nr:AmmeMemoRadiSam system protein B [Candidatus Paceibacterota bacterium]
MKKLLISSIFIFLSLLFCVGIFQDYFTGIFSEKVSVNLENLETVKNNSGKKEYTDFHFAYFQNKEFYGDLEKADSEIKISEKVDGGIVSHHFLVAPKIASFFAKIGNQKIETVVILGPNHFSAGDGDILISKYPYNTPWGVLEPDEKVIEELLKEKFVENDEFPFKKEHSISSLAGFIKYFSPEAKIAPIILKQNVSFQEAGLLAKKLDEILGENSVVLASVDFSHHLNRIAAQFHDEASVSVIENFDYERIYNLEIDSPPSIYTLLKYLEKRGSQKMIYENINSAVFSDDLDSEDVTSYLFSHFVKGEHRKEAKLSLLNFGDTMLGRGVEKIIKDERSPFEKIRGVEGNFLKGVDFTSVNLEGPITENTQCQKKAYSFRFLPKTAKLLFENKINIANLANNHSFDCGEKGMSDTKENLDYFGINYFGGNELSDSYIIKEVNDKKIAFVGIDDTFKKININEFYNLIKDLKKRNNYIVVNIHWGYEYNKLQSKSQTEIAHKLIDSGADVIIGHHPHVIQPMEIYKSKAIFYSLGNFVFDQIPKETNEGFGVGIILGNNINKFYIFPYEIINYQPTLFSYQEAENFCASFLKDVRTKDVCQFEIEI